MSDFSVDHIVKKALRQMEQKPPVMDIPSFDDLDWDGDKEFDATVKGRLSSLDTVPSESSDWDEFIKSNGDQIDQVPSVDEIVKSEIADSSPGFQTTSWDQFVHTLDLHDRRLKTVAGAKVVELLLLLLLFWLGFPSQYLQNNSGITKKNQEIHTPTGEIAAESLTPDKFKDNAPAEYFVSGSLESMKSNETVRFSTKDTEETSRSESLLHRKSEHAVSETESITPLEQNKSQVLLTQNTLHAIDHHVPELLSGLNGTIIVNNEGLNPDYLTRNNKALVPLSKITLAPLLPIPMPALNLFDKKAILQSPIPEAVETRPPYKQTLGFVTAWNHNRIRTSADPVYPVGARTQLDRNVYLGIEWEERTGNNAFGIHAGYQQWHYEAPQYNEIFQRQGAMDLQFIRLEDLRFDVLSFGLFARKYWDNSGKWSYFLHFGGGMQLAINSNYRIRSGEIGDINIDRNDLSPEEIALLPEIPKLWEKNFQEGVFQGGSINENSFMTLNLGGGVIRQISDKWVIQFSPMFNLSPFSDGLGPNRDKIQSLSFQFHLRRIIK